VLAQAEALTAVSGLASRVSIVRQVDGCEKEGGYSCEHYLHGYSPLSALCTVPR